LPPREPRSNPRTPLLLLLSRSAPVQEFVRSRQRFACVAFSRYLDHCPDVPNRRRPLASVSPPSRDQACALFRLSAEDQGKAGRWSPTSLRPRRSRCWRRADWLQGSQRMAMSEGTGLPQ
jgi:hypothetical protein